MKSFPPARPGCAGAASSFVRSLVVLLTGAAAFGATAAPAEFWCESTDPAKLNLTVTEEDGRYFLSDVADYRPADRSCYYFINWDLQGTHRAGRRIDRVEVEPNSLYLVHLYELSRSKNLTDFWAKDPRKGASVAFVWVGGKAPAPRDAAVPGANASLTEVREDPAWFHFDKGDRLPTFTRRFPEFKLPAGKMLSVAIPRAQDTFDDLLRRGVTHFQSGGGDSDKLPRERRLLCMPTGYLNEGIGQKPSGVPHISPTENTFMSSPRAYAVGRAKVAAAYDYIFLDEEFWHSDYQPATLECLCLFAREARRINPTLKLADFWNTPPYHMTFLGLDGWTAGSMHKKAASAYVDANAALKSAGTPAMVRKVEVDEKQTSLADELSAVSLCVYFDNLFGYIDQYQTFSNDLFIPAAIHNTRVNRRLACNKDKPIVWFGMELLEGKYEHPRVAYPTRTTNPAGTAIFHERLPVSPNFNEAIGLFGLLEGDGAYLWEPHGRSDGDPNGIFSTLRYCQEAKDDRGEWRPDVKGTPIGSSKSWYPPYVYTAPDYYALGAWKYAQIADVVTRGKRVDFEYSADGGKTWYVPPASGATMPDVIRDKRPIVTGAVAGDDVAVVAFNPFQGVADTAHLLVRYDKTVFALDLFGTRTRVYNGKIAAPVGRG